MMRRHRWIPAEMFVLSHYFATLIIRTMVGVAGDKGDLKNVSAIDRSLLLEGCCSPNTSKGV
jgi:hypothetical protein